MQVKPILPKSEFKTRYERARKAMERAGLDALVSYNFGNSFWFSGYEGWADGAFTHSYFFPKIVFPRVGDPAILQWEQAVEACRRSTWIDDVRGYGGSKSPTVTIAEALRDRKVEKGRIGVDLSEDAPTIDPVAYENLKNQLPEAKFTDATALLQELRMIKTEAEISFIKIANEIQSRAYSQFMSRIRRGMTETQVMGEMTKCQFDCGATGTSFINPLAHPNFLILRSSSSERLLKKKDFLFVDVSTSYKGYKADFNRFFAIGESTSEQEKVHKTLRSIHEKMWHLYVPGAKFSDLGLKLLETYKKFDVKPFSKDVFIGHGLGYNQVERPWFGTWSGQMEVRENMAISIEYFVPTKYGIMPYEEDYVVRANGPERLSNFPNEIHAVSLK